MNGYLAAGSGASFVGRSFDSAEHWFSEMGNIWQEGIKTVQELLAEIKSEKLPPPKSRKRKRRIDETNGDDIDLDRLRQGEAFWHQIRRDVTTGPTSFTIIADASTNYSHKSRDILWKAAAGVATTHLMEEAGYRVELWLVEYAQQCFTDATDLIVATQIKRSQDPLNISKLSSVMSGWFYRTGLFAASCLSVKNRTACDSLGYPNYALTKEHVQQFTNDPNYLVIKPTGKWDAVQTIKKAVTQLTEASERTRK
jgi:hypothetical protein